MSSVILWCEGKGCFRISNVYRFPISEQFYLEMTKNKFAYSYHAILKKEGIVIIDTELVYNIFQKDVPIQKAYTLKRTMVNNEIDNIPGLKKILEQIKKNT